MERIFLKNFGVNSIYGSIFIAIISYIMFLKNIESIAKLNNIIVPLLICVILIIGIINFLKIDLTKIGMNLQVENSLFWIFQAIIYSSYNLILVIPVLINLKKFIKNKNQILIISIFVGIIISIISILTFLLLVNIDTNFEKLEMPIIYVIKNNFTNFEFVYGIIILIAIFTTAISVGISFLNNICKNKKIFLNIAFLICFVSVIVSPIGFSKLVQTLFPLFGYLGLVQMFFILIFY